MAKAASAPVLKLDRPGMGSAVPAQPTSGALHGTWRSYAESQFLGPRSPECVPDRIRKLMRLDGQISLGMLAVKAPFYGITFHATGGSARAQALLRSVLLENPVLSGVLTTILNALDFGRSVGEIVWQREDVALDPDGSGGPLPASTLVRAYTIRKVEPLDPETTEVYADEFGEFAGVHANGVELPPSRCLLSIHQREFKSLAGQSVLDRAYPYWYDCVLNVLDLNRYLHSKGNPPLIASAPNEHRKDESTGTAYHCMDVLNSALVALKGGGICSIPDERDEKGNPRWSIATLDVKDRAEQFLSAINRNEDMKLRALGVPEKTVTQNSSVGSFAMSDAHVDMFLSALEVIKDCTVVEAMNDLAARIVRYNFGDDEPLPRVEATELSRVKYEVLVELLKSTLNVPHTTSDGKTYTAASLLDVPKILRAVNAPQHTVEEVARNPDLAWAQKATAKSESAVEPGVDSGGSNDAGGSKLLDAVGGITGTIDIATAVARGTIDREAAISMLMLFLKIDRAKAESMLQGVAKGNGGTPPVATLEGGRSLTGEGLAARLARLEGASSAPRSTDTHVHLADGMRLDVPAPVVNLTNNFDPIVEALRNMGPVGSAVASVASGILGVERAITSGRDAIVSKLSAVMSLVSRQKPPRVDVNVPAVNLDPIASAIREATASVMAKQAEPVAQPAQKIEVERDRDGKITGARVRNEA